MQTISFDTQKDIVISLIANMEKSFDREDFIYNTELAKKEFKVLAQITKQNNISTEIEIFHSIKQEFITQHDAKSLAFKQQAEKEKAINEDYKATNPSALESIISNAFNGVIKTKPAKQTRTYSLIEIEKQITDSFKSPLLVNSNGSLNSMTKKLLLSRLNTIVIDSNETRRRVKGLLEKINSKIDVISSEINTNQSSDNNQDTQEHAPIYASYKGKTINIAPLYNP